jgi:Peptidase M61 N-terminal domain
MLAALLTPGVASADGFVAKPSLATQQEPATLVLDASRAADGIVVVRERIPATAGRFTIVYPKWIPGEHGPTGPLNDLAALRISADGAPLDWRRDPDDLYAFHVDVPAGTQALDAQFDVLMNA